MELETMFSSFFVAAASFLHLAPCCYLPLLVHILENIYFDAYVSLQAECLLFNVICDILAVTNGGQVSKSKGSD